MDFKSKKFIKIKRTFIILVAMLIAFTGVMSVSSLKSRNKSGKDKEVASSTTEVASTTETTTETTTAESTTKPDDGKTRVYLTIDDGPSAYTGQILDILDQYNVKATFFVVNAGYYNYFMKDIVDRGHQIALHSYTHNYSDIYRSADAYYADLNKISALVKEQTGVESNLIRFPGGTSNTVSRKYNTGIMTFLAEDVEKKGYYYYDWHCTNYDAGGAETVAEQLSYCKMYPRNEKEVIVLMHDKGITANALPYIIEYYQSQGMVFDVITPEVTGAHHKPSN